MVGGGLGLKVGRKDHHAGRATVRVNLPPCRNKAQSLSYFFAFVGYLDADANLRAVCVGTGARDNRQYYLDRPRTAGDFHGQSPVLWCAAALLR